MRSRHCAQYRSKLLNLWRTNSAKKAMPCGQWVSQPCPHTEAQSHLEKPIAGESGFSSVPFVMCREVWENCWSKDQVLQTCVLLKCSDSSIPAPGAINVICHREINSECSLSETVAVVSPASRRWKYCFRHEIMKLHTSLLKTKQTVLLLLCGQWWKMIESPGRQLVSWVEKEHPAVVGR